MQRKLLHLVDPADEAWALRADGAAFRGKADQNSGGFFKGQRDSWFE